MHQLDYTPRLSYELRGKRAKEMFMSGSGVIMNGGVSRSGGATIFRKSECLFFQWFNYDNYPFSGLHRNSFPWPEAGFLLKISDIGNSENSFR